MNLDSASKIETSSKTILFNSGEVLNAGEKCRLRVQLLKREKILRQSSEAWSAAATAFLEIRDLRLYRAEGYGDFGRYCKERLHLGKSTVNRQIAIAEVYGALASTGAKNLPTSERQMRPLLPLRQPQEKPGLWHENVIKVWDEAAKYARNSKIELTEKGVKRALHHVGLDAKPKVSKPEIDLEKRWLRLQSILEHEREFWPAEQHHDLSERINALMHGWRTKSARVEHSSPVVDLLSKTTSLAVPEPSSEHDTPVAAEVDIPAPTESGLPIPKNSIVPALPRTGHGFKIGRNKPLSTSLSEDVEDIPDERKPEQNGITAENILKQIRERLKNMASSLQETADNMPENLQGSEKFDAVEQIAGELEELVQTLQGGIDSLIDSGDSVTMESTPPCFVSGSLPTQAGRLIEIIRFVAEAIKAEASDLSMDLYGLASDLGNISWP